MSDPRVFNFAKILVEHSTRVQPGDRILIEATPAAAPLVREVYLQILAKGGHPVPFLQFSEMFFPQHEDLLTRHGSDDQLAFVPPFHAIAYEQFEGRIRIHSSENTRSQSNMTPERSQRRAKTSGVIHASQFRRGAEGSFKWCTTLYPTNAYAQDAGMSLEEYENFVFNAVHAQEADAISYWKGTRVEQQKAIDWLKGKNQVTLRGPNVDLTLSIGGRTFNNSMGVYNMPDGEIYTGPVENSVNGWVKFTYPAIYGGVAVEGAELRFIDGRVVEARAAKNEAYLLGTLDTDAGSRYLGEFAIGTNRDINRFTGNILFDEKIGGSFHMALGAGYPETGSQNHSAIHWDLICDMRQDAEILVDGEPFYRNGEFVFGK